MSPITIFYQPEVTLKVWAKSKYVWFCNFRIQNVLKILANLRLNILINFVLAKKVYPGSFCQIQLSLAWSCSVGDYSIYFPCDKDWNGHGHGVTLWLYRKLQPRLLLDLAWLWLVLRLRFVKTFTSGKRVWRWPTWIKSPIIIVWHKKKWNSFWMKNKSSNFYMRNRDIQTNIF